MRLEPPFISFSFSILEKKKQLLLTPGHVKEKNSIHNRISTLLIYEKLLRCFTTAQKQPAHCQKAFQILTLHKLILFFLNNIGLKNIIILGFP